MFTSECKPEITLRATLLRIKLNDVALRRGSENGVRVLECSSKLEDMVRLNQ